MKIFTANLELKSDWKPKFVDHVLFFAFKDSTEQEFDRLESAGILTKVNYIQYIGCFNSSHSKKDVK